MSDYLELIEKGTSVKAIGILTGPTATSPGLGDFIYRNQYSVFDWGAMPMPPGAEMDNRPVAVVAAFNYDELLRRNGVPVCYDGVINSKGQAVGFSELKPGEIPNAIRVSLVNIIKPTFNPETKRWDYSVFQNPPVNNFVLPIEFIWRAEAGPDSSFWKNVQKGAYSLTDFQLPDDLKPGAAFPNPILDHSSKYEDHDRYFSSSEAQRLSGMSDERWHRLNLWRYVINNTLFDHARKIGIHRPDGKQEFVTAVQDGKSIELLADVAGTWHEDRFEYRTKSGIVVKVSKQTPRDLNKLLNAEWARQCDEAKKRAEAEGHPNWKVFVTARPEPLEAEFFEQYNNLMRSATNEWIGRSIFSDASPLEEACVEFDKYLEDYKARLKRAEQ